MTSVVRKVVGLGLLASGAWGASFPYRHYNFNDLGEGGKFNYSYTSDPLIINKKTTSVSFRKNNIPTSTTFEKVSNHASIIGIHFLSGMVFYPIYYTEYARDVLLHNEAVREENIS